MSDSNKMKYYILADHTGFEKGVNKSIAIAKKGGKAIGAGIAVGAAAGTAALIGMTKVMSDAVELANIQEQAEAKLGSVLEATGNAAGYNLTQLKAMAGAMQGVTTVGDEVTISGMAILATFKQIRGEGFERATAAALDMSAVMKTDLNSSIVQIGKALNDPITGLSSLTRVGVTFTDQQKEQIKALQQSGDMYGAQSVILKELETQFGGTAAALRDTYGGAIIAAKNAFGDLQEEVGFAITKNEAFVALAHEAEETFISWTESVAKNKDAIAEFATGTLNNIKSVVEAIGNAFILTQKWSAELESVGNKRTILALREELGVLNEELYRAKNGWFGFGKASEEEIELAERKVSGLLELIQELEAGEIKGIGLAESVKADLAALDQIEVQAKQTGAAVSGTAAAVGSSIVGTANKTSSEIVAIQKAAADKKKALLDEEVAAAVKAGGQMTDSWQLMHEDRYEVQSRALDGIVDAEEQTVGVMGEIWTGFSGNLATTFQITAGDGLRGEFDSIGSAFDSLLSNMLSSFIGVLASMAAEWAAQAFIDTASGAWNSISSSGSSGSTAGSIATGVVAEAGSSVVSGIISSFFADGGAPKASGLGQYRNSVVSSPTIFPFASGGAFGLMGEAGSEAILPLSRVDGGNMGVSANIIWPDSIEDATEDNTDELENSSEVQENLQDSTDINSETTGFNSETVGLGTVATTAGTVAQEQGTTGMGILDFSVRDLAEKVTSFAAKVGVSMFTSPAVATVSSPAISYGVDAVFDSIFGEDDYDGYDGGDPGGDGGVTGMGDDNDGGMDGGWGDDGDMGMDNEGYAHSGGYLEKDEGKIIALSGEGVLSRTGMANLHRLNTGSGGGDDGVIEQLRQEVLSANMKIIGLTRSIEKMFSKWDRTGMPQTRTA